MAFFNFGKNKQASVATSALTGGTNLTLDDGLPEDKSPVLYRCVEQIVNACAPLDLVISRGDEAIVKHSIGELFNRKPNDYQSALSFKQAIFQRLELSESGAYVYVERDAGTSSILGLHLLTGARVETYLDDTSFIADKLLGYKVSKSGGDFVLLPEELLHIRYPDPNNPYAHKPPYRSAEQTIELDEYARVWQRQTFATTGTAGLVVKASGVDEKEFEDIKKSVAMRNTGAKNPNKALLLASDNSEATFDVTDLTVSSREMDYVASRGVNAEQIMLAFGIPKDLLTSGSTYENQKQAQTNFWTNTIIPKLATIASEIDLVLLPDEDLRADYNISEVDALRENEDAIIERIVKKSEKNLITLNEGRAEMGYEPMAGGDVTAVEFQAQFAKANTFSLQEGRERKSSLEVRSVPDFDTDEYAKYYEDMFGSVDKRITLLEKQGEKLLVKLFAKQSQIVVNKIKRSEKRGIEFRLTADNLWDKEFQKDTLIEHLELWLTTIGISASDDLFARIFKLTGGSDELLVDLLAKRLNFLADKVNETTFKALDKIVLEAVKNGEAPASIAKRVSEMFDDISEARAYTIARTETNSMWNNHQYEIMKASGLVVGKIWHTSPSKGTRETHSKQAGTKLTGSGDEIMDRKFANGCAFPHDPDGAVGEVVNCKCYIEWITPSTEGWSR